MSEMKLCLRPAAEKDVSTILEIVNHEIIHSLSIYDRMPRTLAEQFAWFMQKREQAMPVIVAETAGRVLAYGTYGIFRPKEGYRFCVEHSIYVSLESRGKGIGRQLMKALIRLAKDEGYHSMIAGIDASNRRSYDFHRQFGFVEAGYLKEVGYKFDRWLDLIFMQLLLNNDSLIKDRDNGKED